jgi:hypothetical protein
MDKCGIVNKLGQNLPSGGQVCYRDAVLITLLDVILLQLFSLLAKKRMF